MIIELQITHATHVYTNHRLQKIVLILTFVLCFLLNAIFDSYISIYSFFRKNYRGLLGTLVRGYFGALGSRRVLGRRNWTEVRTFLPRLSLTPFLTAFLAFRALSFTVSFDFGSFDLTGFGTAGLGAFGAAASFAFGGASLGLAASLALGASLALAAGASFGLAASLVSKIYKIHICYSLALFHIEIKMFISSLVKLLWSLVMYTFKKKKLILNYGSANNCVL